MISILLALAVPAGAASMGQLENAANTTTVYVGALESQVREAGKWTDGKTAEAPPPVQAASEGDPQEPPIPLIKGEEKPEEEPEAPKPLDEIVEELPDFEKDFNHVMEPALKLFDTGWLAIFGLFVGLLAAAMNSERQSVLLGPPPRTWAGAAAVASRASKASRARLEQARFTVSESASGPLLLRGSPEGGCRLCAAT